ncbi:hypothetical protein CEXT_368891 [Caerostris extrusa]|uniref:Uncharacterized protein n=1 Tax=Caerostris extrusa TaxID=172846 RepID=A0AAV4P9C9_CAEEX|nr:hypothetical protein CEXT_368891 [Caerostris extrusa]
MPAREASWLSGADSFPSEKVGRHGRSLFYTDIQISFIQRSKQLQKEKLPQKPSTVGSISMIHQLYSTNNSISHTKSHRRERPLAEKEMGKSMLLKSLSRNDGMGGKGEKDRD